MAILFMDGLDVYENVDALTATGWSYRVGTTVGTFSTSAGRFGGGAIVALPASNSVIWQMQYALANNKDYFWSFSLKVGSLPTAVAQRIVAIVDPVGNTNFLISIMPSGAIRVSDALLATTDSAGAVVAAGSWMRVEIKINFGTSTTTGSMEIRVNGATAITLTGQNYFSSAGGALLRYYNDQGTGSPQARWFDDIVINDTTGTTGNTWLGDVRIDTLQPTADTAQADWTKNTGTNGAALIDDTLGTSDGDTTYLSSNTVGNKSEFDVTNLASASVSVFALQMRVCAERSGLSARTFRSYLKSSTAVSNGPTMQAFALTYAWNFGGIVNADPNTSGAWNNTSVNAAQLGLELVS